MNRPDSDLKDDLRPEYGPDVFAGGIRGKYYARYQAGTNLALLAPDIRAAFLTDEAVNEALRIAIAHGSGRMYDFKQEYLDDVGVSPQTYSSSDNAIQRVRSIYQTARKGRLNQWIASDLWESFYIPLRERFSLLTPNLDLYDSFALAQIGSLAGHLRSVDRGDFGTAQKMFNLFMKDHWALGTFTPEIDLTLHVPIDQNIINRLANKPEYWSAWTKVVDTIEARGQYQSIQDRFRSYCHRTQRFRSPVEMDQFMWHRI